MGDLGKFAQETKHQLSSTSMIPKLHAITLGCLTWGECSKYAVRSMQWID